MPGEAFLASHPRGTGHPHWCSQKKPSSKGTGPQLSPQQGKQPRAGTVQARPRARKGTLASWQPCRQAPGHTAGARQEAVTGPHKWVG